MNYTLKNGYDDKFISCVFHRDKKIGEEKRIEVLIHVTTQMKFTNITIRSQLQKTIHHIFHLHEMSTPGNSVEMAQFGGRRALSGGPVTACGH